MAHSLFSVMPVFVILFWLVLFYLDENKNKAKQVLIVFLFVGLINYAIHWSYFNHNYKVYHICESIWVFTSLSVFPLYYYYIRVLANDIEIDYRWSFMLIPALSLALFSAIIFIMMSPKEIEVFMNEILYHNRQPSGNYSVLIELQIMRLAIFKVIFTLGVILTLYFGLRHIRRFNKKVLRYYSNVEDRELYNIRITLLFLMFAAVISIISNQLSKGFFIDNQHLLAIPSITHSIALFGICYAGYNQTFSIRELTEDVFQSIVVVDDPEEEMEQEGGCLRGCQHDELYNKMEYLLKEEQIFRNSDLKLTDLALELGTNRTYVSKLINNRANTNFCNYINGHRIKYAKQLLLSDNEELLLQDIAIEAGFSSNSSFYRVFTKMEKTTPAKFREKEKLIVKHS